MPLYEYHCPSCGEFEAFRSIAERDSLLNCPDCRGETTRLFTPPNLISLNSGRLSHLGRDLQQPTVVQRPEQSPAQPRYQTTKQGRPWMISHGPPRF